jgi:hypothetical protein
VLTTGPSAGRAPLAAVRWRFAVARGGLGTRRHSAARSTAWYRKVGQLGSLTPLLSSRAQRRTADCAQSATMYRLRLPEPKLYSSISFWQNDVLGFYEPKRNRFQRRGQARRFDFIDPYVGMGQTVWAPEEQ